MESSSQLEEIPEEIRASVLRLVASVDEVEASFDAVMRGQSYEERTAEMPPLDKAKLDLTFLYGMNALYWVYLRCQGHDPSVHSVRSELDRVLGSMRRVQSEAEKARRPRVDVDAARRFVKASLWRAAHDKARKRRARREKEEEEGAASTVAATTAAASSSGDEGDDTTVS